MSAVSVPGIRWGAAIGGPLLLTGLLAVTFRQPSEPSSAAARAAVCLLAFQPCVLLAWHPRLRLVSWVVTGWSLSVALWLCLLLRDPAIAWGAVGLCAVAVCGWRHRRLVARWERERALAAEQFGTQQRVETLALDGVEAQREALGEKLRRHQALEGVAEQLATSLDRRRVARIAVEQAAALIGRARRTALFLVDEAQHQLSLAAWCGETSLGAYTAKRGDLFDEWVLKECKPLHVADARKDFRFSSEQTERLTSVRSLIGVPLVSRSRVAGVLRMEHETPEIFTPDDLRLLDIISDLAAIAADNAVLFQQTEELAVRDGLTGLMVRRCLDERLEEEWRRTLRTSSRCALLLIDIDHFKWYNDTHGHIAGDVLLQRLAELLIASSEVGEFVARYGGEEFAVLMPLAQREVAVQRAEALRRRVEQEVLVLRQQETRITISIGVAFFDQQAGSLEAVIRLADQMLYQAKAAGRNRVCVAG